jgi:SAM-dependent methyltransferase
MRRGANMTFSRVLRRPAYYDDGRLNYRDYWTDRTYEHAAEVMAVRRLLRGGSYRHAVDVGGGFGRISVVLSDYADRVTLVDSSRQQLDLSESFLSGHNRISARLMDASDLEFPDDSADLVSMIRVLHHLPEPARELREVHRVLSPGGQAVIEVANVAHAMNRVRYLLRGRPIPLTPVDIRSERRRGQGGIPFVNHHPATLVGQLQAAGLRLERMLSVSNLRHPKLTRSLPRRALLAVEDALQERLAWSYFGPSVFLLLRKPALRKPA